MAYCLIAPSHYLNHSRLIISKVIWHPSESNSTRDTSAINCSNASLKITYQKFHSDLPGSNELICSVSLRRTEMALYIQERAATGVTKRLTASEVFTFMNQQNIKNQLGNELSVCELLPKMGLTGEQLKTYLDNPPSGKMEVHRCHLNNVWNPFVEIRQSWGHFYLGQVMELWLSCYLVLLSIDSKTR